ncbi:MAG: amidohydrolase family protein [Spirochaetes bacterium]|nr:amidohydrolase family protein [Spirochaetota bacterium]
MKVRLFKNGKIYSIKKDGDYFRNMLAINGKIYFTSDEDISISRYLRDKDVEVKIYDLDGKTCIPSFCDAHIHLSFGAKTFEFLDLQNCFTLEKIFDSFEHYFENKENLSNEFIIGFGFDKNNFDKKQSLNKYVIDQYIQNKYPNLKENIKVLIYSKDYHSAYVNTNLLNFILKRIKLSMNNFFSKIIKGADNMEGIIQTIDKENGIFYENSLKFLSNTVNDILNSDDERIIKSIKKFVKYLQSFGITAVSDCALLFKDSSFRYFQKIEHENIAFRNLVCIPEDALDKFIDLNLITGKGSNYFKVGPLKLIYDGSIGSQTAYVDKPYYGKENDKYAFGIKNYSPKYIKEILDKCLVNNIGLAIHAIGNRANREVIEIFSNIRSLNSNVLLRLEHAQILEDDEIQKLKHLNIFVVMQPVHIDQDYYTYQKYLNEYIFLSYRFRSLMNNNVTVAFSTDFPVAKINPFYGIFASIYQEGFDISKGKIFNPEEKISLFDAIRNYTYNSHKASLFENSGILSEGYNADLIVLDRDIFSLSNPYEIIDTKVIKTYFEGEEIFSL